MLSVRLGGLKVLVLQPGFEVLLCDKSQQSSPLVLPGFGVEKDTNEDQDGPGCAQDRDAVAEDEDAEPHRQGVLHRTGNTEEEEGGVSSQVQTSKFE